MVLKQYYTPLESIKLPTGNGKSEMLNLRDIVKDIFALHVHESENADYMAFDANLLVQQEQVNRLTKLKKDHARAVMQIQKGHGVKYSKGLSF